MITATDRFAEMPPKGPQRRPVSEAMLRISNLLTEKNIYFPPKGLSKQQIIGRLVGVLDLRNPTSALEAVLAREQMDSTLIAPGVCLPHARFPQIDRFLVSLGISATGVVDRVRGGPPIHVFLLLLSPLKPVSQHLSFLAAASHLFHRKGLVSTLTKLKNPKRAIQAIGRAESGGWHQTLSLIKIP